MAEINFNILVFLIIINICNCITSSAYNVRGQEKQIRDEDTETKAVEALLERLIPSRSSEFLISVNYSFYKSDAFQIETNNEKILITGNRGYSAAAGLQHYLKYYCKAHISWSGTQLQLPSILPKPKSPKRITFNDKYRYYMNVCTLSYSTVWWNWTRWEKEIDWMALNGINLPLAFTGQEYFWRKVFLAFNFTYSDIDDFFTGPAFLAWNRMGNVQKWGGSLSDYWITEKKNLLHKIINRMRDFGMIPVLPAFSGRVPPAIQRIYPNASVAFLGRSWGGFSEPYSPVTFLEPTDPLFGQIGETFLEYYIEEFGTDHIYNIDLFNEMAPPSSDLDYFKDCGQAVYKMLISKDPEAIWLMQGWMFLNDPVTWTPERAKALLTSVPIGRMIVLDLSAELYPQYPRLNSFFGQPFIWSTVQNYGGVLGLYGNVEAINEGPFAAREFPNSTMIGTGIAPEGIENNDVVYELINELAWRKSLVRLDKWMCKFAKRRYGKITGHLSKAVTILQTTVYNAAVPNRNHGQYILIRRPSLKLKPMVWYNPADVFEAWTLFVNSSVKTIFQNSELFKHDLVDLTRQNLQLIMDGFYSDLRNAYFKKNLSLFTNISSDILSLYDDMEEILSTDATFLLGTWINEANTWAQNQQEKIMYEFNAKNQISLWGPSGQILDYAAKQWAGIMSRYYKKRWGLMIDTLKECLITSRGFNQSEFNDRVLNTVEIPFNKEAYNYSSIPKGDAIKISRKLLQKYQQIL